MKIVEYDEVDPLKVLYVTQLALGFTLTPELAAEIRHSDPRPFPCLAICAVEGEEILGHVGIFRLPMISIEGREDVGGVWAVSTHPQYAERGVASMLIEEAHNRMKEAGLRFSTLNTDRYRLAHKLYRRLGYLDTNVWGTALSGWDTAHQPTRLRAEPAGPEGYEFAEQTFRELAADYLGFAWRHAPFARLRQVSLQDIWILRENQRVVGYALTQGEPNVLAIRNLVLRPGIDPAEAVAAVVAEIRSTIVQVTVSRPVEASSLHQAGFHVARPSWSSFMIKPLVPGVSAEDAMRLFGIGTDRFMISWLDVT
jgi:GNAT superfamily N-acetyltransferase